MDVNWQKKDHICFRPPMELGMGTNGEIYDNF